MSESVYDTLHWQQARTAALARDNHECKIGSLFGGLCSDRLDVHHLKPVAEGGAPYELRNLLTCCSSHHRELEALRKHLRRKNGWRRCRHEHRTSEGRRLCEERLNRDLVAP